MLVLESELFTGLRHSGSLLLPIVDWDGVSYIAFDAVITY